MFCIEHSAGEVRLMIKKYPNGKMSSHIHDLKLGETYKSTY